MAESPKLYALLLDGDNIQAPLVPRLLDKIISTYGKPIIKRVYLNSSSLTTTHWTPIINEYSLKPEWIPNNTNGKNASDIALVIDAMDLFCNRADLAGFCIVSSDSDFTRLAAHIVEKRKFVLGIGEDKTPNSFVKACSQFVYIEDLLETQLILGQAQDKPDNADTTVPFESLFIQAYGNAPQNQDRWAQLIAIKEVMNALDSEFQFSTRQLAEKVKLFAESYPIGVIEIDEKSDGKPIIHYVRIDCETFRFIDAYKQASVDETGWVLLSVIGDELSKQSAYKVGFSYRGIKRLSKVVTQMSKDYPKVIKFKQQDEKPGTYLVRIKL